ncbi:4Fe-4S binding protein [Geobacter sulfurreducens subsp. ethanolicus]|uniref:4Fe-4S binding protein n=1 Tax=Geobacter sulfurreducens TaxID=35554 RepID=UPI0025727790|nr:4Fe-4S binding protein [Geobacter sulfurreducens]BEH11670.1 4Fe-4S binding protein [Geobacter sulfurreducens subsp. ethanolicus]
MNNRQQHARITLWRALVQWGFFAWVVVIGIRFGVFVRHFETGGATPLVSRPPGVEGFLPIGALAGTKLWLATGTINPVHPAALVIFLTIVGMSLVAKKSFCSWLCPVGTLSEAAWKLGQRLFGRNFRVWPRLDWVLRGAKYLLLLFFVKIILVDMPVFALAAFLDTPYWAVSDVKMLHFFTRMSGTTITVLAVLTVLSLLYKNAWCRYLCPYGALLGVASFLSPFKIRRDAAGCTGCRNCSRACPSGLPVHERETIRSAECTGCLTCVANCPQREVLRMAPPFWRRPLPAWVFPAVVLLLFAAGIGTGMATGAWQSSLTYEDYRQLIPMVPYLSH